MNEKQLRNALKVSGFGVGDTAFVPTRTGARRVFRSAEFPVNGHLLKPEKYKVCSISVEESLGTRTRSARVVLESHNRGLLLNRIALSSEEHFAKMFRTREECQEYCEVRNLET